MDFESYLRVLLSVWIGLGLSQLVMGLHRLARFKGTIRWDWLPVTWSALAFLMFVQSWWAYYTLLQAELWTNLFVFLLPLSVFVVMYLICAAALPDATKASEGSTIDLRAHYLGQHRYFFALWSLYLLFSEIVSALARGDVRVAGSDGFRIVGFLLAVILMWSPRRKVHVIVTVLSSAALVTYIILYTLTLS